MDSTARTVNVGLIGLGTVGGGVARLIERHRDEYLKAYGIDLRLKKASALEPGRAAELGIAPENFTTDWHDVVADPDIDIVIELIGGDHPATEIFEAALTSGKHMVSANKALLGRHVERLAKLAAEHGVQIRCEASAGGGIPIVNALEHALVGNEILTVAGILNGTTNYILTRMASEGLDFAEVLADAQRLGYAEADPTADVDGFDAASKVAILSSIAFHTRVTTDDVFQEGIRNVSAADIAQAKSLGYVVKLLGIARNTADGVDVRVHPTMIPADHMLASVSGAMNAVYVVGDAVGETMFYGAGAGSFPTASAVVGDVLALADAISHNDKVQAEIEPYQRVLPLRPIDELETRYYVRLLVKDEVGTLAPVVDAFAAHGISISQINQLQDGDGSRCSVVFLTHTARERDMAAARAALEALDAVESVASVIRIEDVASWADGAEKND
ncbi:homoserine dehydrogenase [Collinsella tanakaei]|uniref:Homoserine dehydrogenase n=1 Tax=Collinsella ihumii TaxID=1720204 RepID=A0ABT7XGU7_9ACTN|nr:homoserine dehydrogenase [Collinsella ihumii]MBM6776954.1 homoserine dehydrogenase [Collinsella tanakaei]MBM6786564.1 homoserine dehydrogenase [Collinsella tanakaei]MBM6906107.1 homoserine dehydrogenase [Collinsella tanakaei]MDN0055230.1 homoserine dehydrogenase [Collinsella ihumii]MDN0064635.1 homoserine dehydrogenase [Collinsella ihumii]